MAADTQTSGQGDIVSRLNAGETVYSAWSTFRDPAVAEALARASFDLVTIDMQHGAHDIASATAAIGAATSVGTAIHS